MLGLTGYSSSEEELDEPHETSVPLVEEEEEEEEEGMPEWLFLRLQLIIPVFSDKSTVQVHNVKVQSASTAVTAPQSQHQEPDPSAPTQGPSLPPAEDSFSRNSISFPADDVYGANLTNTIYSLTMPPVPNFDIPPSPPGSPPSSTAKFARFLELKKRTLKDDGGVHFNAKLASSTALANPAFLDKMMDMAGMSTEDSHALAEPEDLGLPKWPQWAKAEELNKTQKRLARKMEREKGERVEFVPAGAAT